MRRMKSGNMASMYHVEFFLPAKHHGEEEGGDNAASHRDVLMIALT